MKLSNILLVILALLVFTLYMVGITVPQPTLDANEWYFAACIMPIIGGVWLWFLVSAKKGG